MREKPCFSTGCSALTEGSSSAQEAAGPEEHSHKVTEEGKWLSIAKEEGRWY